MKYSKEAQLEVGRKIHESGISNPNTGIKFGISEESARRYRILYERFLGIDRDSSCAHKGSIDKAVLITPGDFITTSDDYSSITKEKLIEKLMKSKTREARLKERSWCRQEVYPLDSRNTK